MLKLSVVIPAYNEENALVAHFDALIPALDQVAPGNWELLVVDDGSNDGTFAVAAGYGHPAVRVLRHSANCGKGAAVKSGILASRGDAVLVCDADMSTPPSMLEPFLEALRQGADIVIGNRRDPHSEIGRRQSRLRCLLGKGFIWISVLTTATAFADYNCGFKLFRGTVAREVFAMTTTSGWAYDIETLALAVRRGYRVEEIPVPWSHADNSCVRLPGDIFRTLRELLFIWAKLHFGPAGKGSVATGRRT